MNKRRPEPTWDLDEELGGPGALEALVTDLYDRLFDDPMIGFFFWPHEKSALIAHQISYARATLGRRAHAYQGRPIGRAHASLPILAAHFDRRHTILAQVLADHGAPEHVRSAWLALDASLKPLIVRRGAAARGAPS